MQMTFKFPRRDGDLLVFLAHFVQQVTAERAALGVSEAELAQLVEVVRDFQKAMMACEPMVRNRSAVIAKDEACTLAKTVAYRLAMAIGVRSDVSAAQKFALNIQPRKARTRSGPPAERPSLDIQSAPGREIVVRLNAGPSTVPGVASALLFAFVGDTFPSDASQWSFVAPLTRPQGRIELPDTVPAGAKVWVCAAYCSRRGERGPMSLPVSTYLQIGGVSRLPSASRAAA